MCISFMVKARLNVSLQSDLPHSISCRSLPSKKVWKKSAHGRMVILVNEDTPDSDGFSVIAAEKVTAESDQLHAAPWPRNYLCHFDR